MQKFIINICLVAAIIFMAITTTSFKKESIPSVTPLSYYIDGNLDSFFAKLRDLERFSLFKFKSGRRDISIVHIGDSHIQAGFMSACLRSHFQNRFGDAGRGLVVPLKLARTNEPTDYRITSSGRWNSSRINGKDDSEHSGVGGVSIYGSSSDIDIKLLSSTDEASPFNEITIFHSPSTPEIELLSDYDIGLRCQDTVFGVTTTIALGANVDSVRLRVDSNAEFYGFDLRNSGPGIVYHSIGVNGACYVHYAQNSNALRQLSLLAPSLIIVSMGTNESSGRRFNEEQFYGEIDRMVSTLKSDNPQSCILLTTPAPFYRKGVENPNVSKAAATIVKYAHDNSLAVFDMYQQCKKSGSYNVDSPFYAYDKIHFTKDGYGDMGDMIYGAIMNIYEKYSF